MKRSTPLLAAVLVVSLAGVACSSSTAGSSATTTVAGQLPCPTAPVKVVVTVNQWADIAKRLGGACTEVTTVIAGATTDPHDYEPTPGDAAEFNRAKVVIQNGLGYDAWAGKAVDAMATGPIVVDAGEVIGREEGDNPHVWYNPTAVPMVATAITTALKEADPAASAYFDAQATAWDASMQPYRDEVSRIAAAHAGTPFGATESVFDDMADAVGLQNLTPQGYRNASANDAEPSPGDLAEFDQALEGRQMKVLVYNVQTEGSVPEQIRATAERVGIPVVEVTETVPASAVSFVDWQVLQLRALASALGSS